MDVIKKALHRRAQHFEWQNVLEPSAGTGALLDLVYDCYAEAKKWVVVDAIDICPLRDDVRKVDVFDKSMDNGRFETIVANPPFSCWRRHFRRYCELLDAHNGEMIIVLPATLEQMNDWLYGEKELDWEVPLQVQHIGTVSDFKRLDCKGREKSMKVRANVFSVINYCNGCGSCP